MSLSAIGIAAALAALLWQGHAGHAPARQPALYEYVLVGIATVAMVWTVYLAVRYTLHPGEEERDHIKRLILEDGDEDSHG